MASDPVTKVLRSGDLYLLIRGDFGRVLDPERSIVPPAVTLGSLLAHTPVSNPWETVESSEVLPPRVAGTIAETEWESITP